ncbi:integrin alpha-7 isoform X5 [Ictidomys tridecemlineatus]
MAGARSCDSWGPPGICYLLGFLFAGLLFPRAVAFNLDVMGALRKEGEPGSLFGFSVALHRQLQPRPQSWLLVGAPQALALPGQQANRTGGLFACPLSLEETDCYRVDIDRGADVQKESKENQWLGVSVRSQGPGGKIVTCAHRYESRQRVDQILETRDVIGRCFVLSQDLAIRDELDGGEWKFCEGRPQGHEQFGFCQQGTAAAFSPDSHYLLFGAPGTYNWKGLLFVTNIDSSDPDQLVYKTLDPADRLPGPAGDLALNSYLDIAVGAPFDGDGKVFIYHGSSLGVVIKPSQVLEGEAVGIKSFGYSLSGGLDVDGNHYPDLLVGSLADTVALFRARPVLHVSHEVFIAPRAIDLEQPNCAGGHSVCVDLRICFSYIAVPSSYSPTVALDYVLDGDTDRRLRGQVPRVTFLSRSPDDPKHQASGTVWLKHQHDRVCGDTMFQLQDNVKDKLRAIVVTLSYSLQTPRLRRQALGQGLPPVAPILNAHQPSTQRAEIHFLKQGCGEDKICQSNLQLVHARFCARVSDTEFQPLPMDVDGTTALFALSGQPVIGLELMVTNLPSNPAQPQADGDDAHEAQLLVTLPASLHYSGVRALDPAEKPLCLSNENASHVECELGNPMKRGAQVTFYLILSTSGITIETTELEVELLLATISEQELHPVSARARVFIELPLSIAGVAVPQQLFFSGVVRGESAMRSERDVGSKVKYEVTVSNQGQSLNTLGSAFLNIMWPHEIANGKWLLYPMRVELEGGQGPGQKGLCSPRPNILRLDVDSRDRRRRELEQLEQQEPREQLAPTTSWWPVSSAEKKKNVTLDCARGTANCVVFSCPLYSFDRAAVLHVWGRLWNSTFLEEYSAVKSLEVIVRANITVKSSIKNLLLKDASTVIPVMVYLDPMAVVAEGVPWWVILLAVLAGLLVLALLVLLLWKLADTTSLLVCGAEDRTWAEHMPDCQLMISSQRPQQHLADWLLCGDAHWGTSLAPPTRPSQSASRAGGLWEVVRLVFV